MEQELTSFWQCIRKVHVIVSAGHILQVRSTSCYKATTRSGFYQSCYVWIIIKQSIYTATHEADCLSTISI